MGLLPISSAAAFDGSTQVYYPGQYPAIQNGASHRHVLSLTDSVPISLPVHLSQISQLQLPLPVPISFAFLLELLLSVTMPGLRMRAI